MGQLEDVIQSIVAGETPVDVLEDDASVIYGVDKNFLLIYCNKAWDEFATQNDGARLLRKHQIGRSVLGHIEGPLHSFYLSVFERVLADRQPWEHRYECSSADRFREFQMRILPLQKLPCLIFVNSLIVEKPHERSIHEPIAELYQTDGGVIVMCSHCRRTRRRLEPRVWDWVPAFLVDPPVNVSHGFCPICALYYYTQ